MITIGFTGTRNGMSEMQMRSVRYLVKDVLDRANKAGVVVRGLHGDCLGADADFGLICEEFGLVDYCRPCTFESLRAYVGEPIADPVRPMERNRAIVADATVMIACPPNNTPIKSGSGTWATIRFARKAGKPLATCWPEGDHAIEFQSLGPWVAATCGEIDVSVSNQRRSGGDE